MPDNEDGWLSTLKTLAGGVVSTVGTVVGDVGHTVAEAATGVASTVGTVAADIGHAALDAGTGLIGTAVKVGGDVASGHLGQALGDAEDGIVTTTAHVADDAAHTVLDAGSGLLETAGKVVTGAQRTVADGAVGVVSTAGHVVGGIAQTVAKAAGPGSMLGQAAGAVGHGADAAAGGVVGAINTATDFNKGVIEGAVGGVEGLAKGVVSLGEGVAKEGYALATDEKARAQALQTVEHGAEAVGQFAKTAVTDPGKAVGEVGDAVVSGAKTVGHMAGAVYDDYQKAAATGHGAEFIGKAVGQGAVLVAGAVLTDGASVGAEAGAAGAEGAALLGATEVAGELGAGGAAAGELGAGAADLTTGAARVAERGASAAEELETVPAAIPGAPPRPLPAEFQPPAKPIRLFEHDLQPIEPGSPNLTATPKPSEPIPYELGNEPPPGQVQVRPGDGGPAADPLAQTQELPASVAGDAEKGAGAGQDAAAEPASSGGGEEPPHAHESEPADTTPKQEEQPGQPRERAKERRERDQARGGKKAEAPPSELDAGEGLHDGPEVGDAKIPLDDALDHAGFNMDETEREQFGQWVKDGHEGGQHVHYDKSPDEVRRLQQDVAAFRDEVGQPARRMRVDTGPAKAADLTPEELEDEAIQQQAEYEAQQQAADAPRRRRR